MSAEEKIHQKIFYQTLMSVAFAINTGHKYHFILRLFVPIFIIDWFLMVVLPSAYVFWTENQTLSTVLLFQIVQYIMAGLLYTFIFTVILFKRRTIVSMYELIQTDFIRRSEKRGSKSNGAHRKTLRTYRLFLTLCLTSWLALLLTFFSAIYNRDAIPLNHYSNFISFWPKFITIDGIRTYAVVYTVQMFLGAFIYLSVVTFNIGISAFLNELNFQFEILLEEINEAFDNRSTNQHFRKNFVDCILHHQIIIKFVDGFKSYLKWIIPIEILISQALFAVTIYCMLKENVSFGEKVKSVVNMFFNMCPIYFHCHVGEVILSKHERLAEHIYNKTWYDMPNNNKQLIVMMFQRTQKNLSLKSALFFNVTASMSTMFVFIKQVYTIVNVLLKT